ncbi:FadR/GntR family transcriptional regulator [Actimicrobium sp. CCI2.3]|uniref:FadR/GntR family transcriptional regulator n=1 Tax=Actimicrobium sp. CCI2.3 TaxID=3048616 RepID=UPI002AB51B79|nr:FadR/GntR family transcriptional regulator [Actimicrobium sp. CCI2.3]MDY7573042.1 FadR/GntR family transcriptional regulator [Actimicrobium sp. CCI2.3]MEB0020840.1 FadR/GntR family transcriptional regulator [Actimicrobium sp. CCI2.3]
MKHAKQTATQRTVEIIQEGIKAGTYPVGQALPGQRVLAQELGVGRQAIREAISALEGLGFISVEAGRGTFVVQPDESEARWRFASQYTLEDVYAVRAALESLSVQLIAVKVPLKKINSLDTLVDQLEAAVDDGNLAAMSAADSQFHRKLAELSGNPLLLEILDTFNMVMTESKNIAFLDTSETNHRSVVAEHRGIVASLKKKDPEAASSDMKAHIVNAQKRAHRVRKKNAI